MVHLRCGRRMTELRDALGTVRYSYNRTDAVTEVVDRTGGITRYGYDRLGNKTRETRPEQHESGKGTVYEYDCLDHLVRVTTPEGSVYAYRKGSDDRLLKAVSPNAYDPETGDGDGMAFDHDATGRRIRVHYPDGGASGTSLTGTGTSPNGCSRSSMTRRRTTARDTPTSTTPRAG